MISSETSNDMFEFQNLLQVKQFLEQFWLWGKSRFEKTN